MYQEKIGKLIITTNFQHVKKHQPFKSPLWIKNAKDINIEAKKIIKIITLNDKETIICSGKLISV